jgi:hypothetical protein
MLNKVKLKKIEKASKPFWYLLNIKLIVNFVNTLSNKIAMSVEYRIVKTDKCKKFEVQIG